MEDTTFAFPSYLGLFVCDRLGQISEVIRKHTSGSAVGRIGTEIALSAEAGFVVTGGRC